jgi:NAD(P)-dependent dehydrogenase (short-subunit alcohol dehydrogenase family)
MLDAGWFAGRSAIVTGAASGIGRGVARTLHHLGSRVVALDRNPTDEPGLEVALVVDVRSAREVDAAVREAAQKVGRFAMIVNCAGIALARSAWETTEDEWDEVLDTNLKGAWLVARAAWPHLEEDASIVNVASNAGLVGFPALAAYCAAKGGLIQLTRAMALDATPQRVRVNCICPGHIRTPMGDGFIAAQADPVAFEQRHAAAHPIGRLGTVDDIVQAAIYLLSPASAFVTGSVLVADGGYTAR